MATCVPRLMHWAMLKGSLDYKVSLTITCLLSFIHTIFTVSVYLSLSISLSVSHSLSLSLTYPHSLSPYLSYNILNVELHLAVKSTSTTSTPRHVDVKLRKSPHKEKPKKYKRPQKGRKDVNVDDRDGDDDEQDFTTTTTPDFHTPPQTQTILPSVTHRPSWVLRSGVTKHLSVGNNLKLTLTILFIINRL